MNDGTFNPGAMLQMGATLFVNDQAKQRYFNLGRYIIGCKRLVDAKRDLEMDDVTYNQAISQLGNIANVVQQPVAQPTAQPDIKTLMVEAIKENIKPEALLW